MNFVEPVFINALFQCWKQRKYSYKRVTRPSHGLLYLQSGEIIYRFELGDTALRAGDIVYLPRGSHYEALFNVKAGVIEDYLINFTTPDAQPLFDYQAPTVLINDRLGLQRSCFSETADAFSKGEEYRARAGFYMCLHSVLRSLSEKADTAEMLQLKKGASLLCGDSVCHIDEISQKLNMSRSAFQKKFKAYFGVSPSEYRMADRMNKACRMLDSTDVPIKEIAYSLGFYDVAYFYKRFEKHCHMTPNEYRELNS